MNKRTTILLVDDSENDLFLMRAAFKKAGCNARLKEVSNGEEAIAYLKGEGVYRNRDKCPLPAVMLLDLNLPMKDGFDVVTWVRSQPMLKHLSVIILTGSERIEDVERAFAAGAHAFLVKPPTNHGLVAMIRSMWDWLQYNHFPPFNGAVKRRHDG